MSDDWLGVALTVLGALCPVIASIWAVQTRRFRRLVRARLRKILAAARDDPAAELHPTNVRLRGGFELRLLWIKILGLSWYAGVTTEPATDRTNVTTADRPAGATPAESTSPKRSDADRLAGSVV